jgi:hypothetical protein
MKENFSVKEILGAVDDILKIQSKNIDNELKLSKNFKKNTTTVDTTFQTKPITKSPIKIINEELIKKNEPDKIINNLENKKDLIKDNKKKYDLMVINNAKDVLILNRIIFK